MKLEITLANTVSTEMLEAIPLRGCIAVRLPSAEECAKARQNIGTHNARKGRSNGYFMRTVTHPNAPIIYIHKLATYE